mmetsp:Transcript_39921/g.120646  ORF Transcript_39921/g.120646 Transcript_39921/m.120646 type:complete len:220 (-) Transcript_39921:36-695(-)
MTILQDDPSAGDERRVVLLPRDLLLSLAHRDLVCREFLLLLRQLVDHAGWVGPSRQQVEHRLPRGGLVVDVGHRVSHRGGEARPQLLVDELRASDAGAVLPERANQDEAQEGPEIPLGADPLLELGHRATLGLVFVEPLTPLRLALADDPSKITEDGDLFLPEAVARELQQVQPCLVAHPAERRRPLRVFVQGGPRLQKKEHILRREHAAHHLDFQCDH